ncbi:MAG: hypothetical protein M5U22_05595 [Thermoleophilia bacterium]|nr:hypothetical protein [Thermoleophilia bacterium]
MNRWLHHKWTVGVAALVLVLAFGAVAWAQTGDDTSADTSALPAIGFMEGLGFGPGGHGGRGGLGGPFGGLELTDEQKAQLEQQRADRQAAMEERRDAFLQLVREKMTADDQQKLDELTSTAKDQQEALQAAREALQSTASQLRELVGKYFPGTSTDTTGTTATSVQ